MNSRREEMKKNYSLIFFIVLFFSMVLNGYLYLNYSKNLNDCKTKLKENKGYIKMMRYRFGQLGEDMDLKITRDDMQNLLLSNLPYKKLLVKERITDTEDIKRIKKQHNKIVESIFKITREILNTKIEGLNGELKKRNEELNIKNEELENKINEINRYQKELDEIKKRNTELEKIKQELSQKIKGLEVVVENGKVKVTYKGDLLFGLGSRRIKKAGRKILDKIAPEILKNINKYDIYIAGHTDNIPIKKENKKFESNWDLSSYRAIEVAKYLMSKGVPPESITAAGYGKYRPLVKNDSVKNRGKNRRVEIYLIPKIIKR
jgi:chemotaxis protein MotB